MKTIIPHQKHAPRKAGVPTIAQFVGNLTLGLDFLQTAGAQLVAMKEDDFDVFDRIVEECDWLTLEMLDCIYHIGKKVLHPRLLLMPKHVFDRVCALPYSDQSTIVSQPVAVPPVEREGRRLGEIVLKAAEKLSPAEAARVWPTVGSADSSPTKLSERFTLWLDQADQLASIVPATTNRRAQIINLDENGEAVVQFRTKQV